jgi:GAF domain-containing protein
MTSHQAAERKTAFYNLFIEVTKTITSSLNLDEVFDLIVKKVPDIFNVEAATIRLLDEAGVNLKLMAAHGLSRDYLNRGQIDAEEPVFKALKGEPIFIADAENDSRIKYPQATKQEGVKNILVVPIPIRGEINGILRILAKRPHAYTEEEIEFITLLTEQCGIAIENGRIFKEQQAQLHYFKAIYEISKMIKSTYDLDKILDLIVARLPAVMNQKAATIRLIEAGTGVLALKAAYGLSKAYLQRGPLDHELATYYLKKGDFVVIPDAKSDIHTIYHKEAEAEGIGSILAVPISVDDEIIGILRILSAQAHHFSEVEINFAMTVAEESGIAIQRAINFHKTHSKAMKKKGEQSAG